MKGAGKGKDQWCKGGLAAKGDGRAREPQGAQGLGAQARAGALLGPLRLRPQLLTGAAADNTSAASERELAIAVLSQLLERAAVRDKTARALAL